ncbi:MAG: NADH-quinone oxidoreductase subunit L [Limisphaerales bacterium]
MDAELVSNTALFVLFAPLAAALLIGLTGRGERSPGGAISVATAVVTFIASCTLLFGARGGGSKSWSWIDVSDLQVGFGLIVDHLSLLMLVIVTGVSMLVQIFSLAYMKGDKGFGRYYAFLSFFTFSMLGIVLADNLIMMFVFWELVGVSSYLLISFWFEKPAAADAGKKAFLTNRIGDFGFLFGIIIVWATLGTLSFSELAAKLESNPEALGAMATVAGLLLFCGAVGKSAQFPLHVWLPDAMEGPTPVSALIHAATMVAAGVYMLCRIFFLLSADALLVIGWVGAGTALLAALMACQQNDIKRILAFSTLSQLGYMVMAVGLGHPEAAMFHLSTHAFFKAMLFLGAGSVIYALHHEQNIWKMGGLKHRMPATYFTFLIGTFALCGLPPFSGFYSKDAILAAALASDSLGASRFILFGIGVIVAIMTAFYMTRCVLVAFCGEARGEAVSHADESPGVMVWPLRILMVLTVIGGFIGIDSFMGEAFGHHAHHVAWYEKPFEAFNHSPMAALFGFMAVVLGYLMARQSYDNVSSDPLPLKLGLLARLMRDKFYLDEIYEIGIKLTQETLAAVVDWFDRWIVAGLIARGLSGFADLFGRALRMIQTGNLQTYAFWLAAGVILILFFVLPEATKP